MQHLSLIDYFILCILLYNGFIGLKKGFVRLALDFAAVIGSLALGYRHYEHVSAFIQSFIPTLQAPYMTWVGFAATWALIFIGFMIFNTLVDKMIQFSGLGLLNRTAGLLLGTLKGVIILIPIILPIMIVNAPLLEHSTLVKPSKPFLNAVYQVYIKPITQNTKSVL